MIRPHRSIAFLSVALTLSCSGAESTGKPAGGGGTGGGVADASAGRGFGGGGTNGSGGHAGAGGAVNQAGTSGLAAGGGGPLRDAAPAGQDAAITMVECSADGAPGDPTNLATRTRVSGVNGSFDSRCDAYGN